MRTSYPVLTTVIIFLFLVLSLGRADAFSIRELLGIGEEQEGAGSPLEAQAQEAGAGENADTGGTQNWAAAGGDIIKKELKFNEIRLVMDNVDKKQRDNLLSDAEVFKQFVQTEGNNLSILAAAEANQLHKEPNTVFLMQRSAENILREIYLQRLIASKIPADFPTEEQIQSYYENNKSEFLIGERVHVWQIFLPVAEGAEAKAVAEVEKKAKAIVKELETGKLSFADGVLKYSENLPSKNNGGYMGLLNVETLLPEIKSAVAQLPEGKLSQPVKSGAGLHILKRGTRVNAREIPLELAKDQIRKILLNRAQAQLRNAIFDQAAKTYPVEITDSRIEEWRLRLRTNLDKNQNKPDTAKVR